LRLIPCGGLPAWEESVENSMNKEKDRDSKNLPGTVGKKARRKIKARKTRDRSVWFGLGMFGMVGWTIAVTTVIGVVLGMWIDRTWPGPYSWTLTLLLIGLIVGCLNAWYWVSRESRPEEDEEDEEI